MKTFGYLLKDEANPPKLWEIFHYPDDGLVIFRDPQDHAIWGWSTPENVWEIASF